jgi:hypothetical protein
MTLIHLDGFAIAGAAEKEKPLASPTSNACVVSPQRNPIGRPAVLAD